jgi:hypothetical protein
VASGPSEEASAAPNPYAPPRAPLGTSAKTARAPGEVVTWLYIVVQALFISASIMLVVESLRGDRSSALYAFAHNAERWLVLPNVGAVFAWLFQAWSGVPRAFQRTITPVRAVAYFFVPLYQLYWLLVVNVRLCEALDAALAHAGDERRAPLALARAAPIVTWGAALAAILARAWWPVPLAVGTGMRVVWVVYVLQCDAVRRAVSQHTSERAYENVPAESLPPVRRALAGVALVVLLFLAWGLFFAIWQFLAPGTPHR